MKSFNRLIAIVLAVTSVNLHAGHAPDIDTARATAPQREVLPAPAAAESDPPGVLERSAVQGVVQMDVQADRDRVSAGSIVTYTYRFTNTDVVSHSNVVIVPSWTGFGDFASNEMQTCVMLTCNSENQTGVFMTQSLIPPYAVNVPVLEAGEVGSFQIAVRIGTDSFPRTGAAVRRPAGSAALYMDSNTALVSDDTVSVLIEGPVLTLTKAVVENQPPVVGIGDVVAFRIRMGNAYLPVDRPNGAPRADAIAASNVIVTETLPLGTQLVSVATSGVVTGYNPVSGVLTWTIPHIAVGEWFDLVFNVRVLDFDFGGACASFANTRYVVGAAELPMATVATPHTVAGFREGSTPGNAAVAQGLTPPFIILPMSMEPPSPFTGDVVTVSIRVQNHWPITLTSAELGFELQPNTSYVPGSASADVTSVPVSAGNGGYVTWTFSMAPGTPLTPTFRTFQLQVKHDASIPPTTVPAVAGFGAFSPEVPLKCLRERAFRMNYQPRVEIRKLPGDYSLFVGGEYRVPISSVLPYVIEIQNRTTQVITGIAITDSLPANEVYPPDFTLISGTSRINGALVPPDALRNGNAGHIVWRNITVPPLATARITYNLLGDGYEYVQYCNRVAGRRGTEILTPGFQNDRVCTRFNPPVLLELTGDRTDVTDLSTPASREVTYTLKITNVGERPYRLAKILFLRNMQYVRVVPGSSNNGTPILSNSPDPNALIWPWDEDLQPGEFHTARVVARVPENCPANSYTVELGFNYTQLDGTEGPVVQVPPELWEVHCGGLLRYRKTTTTPLINIGETTEYSIYLVNSKRAVALQNVVVTDTLPSGFTFERMSPASPVLQQPTVITQTDGSSVLVWNVPQIDANSNTRINFVVRAPLLVGTFGNAMTARADNAPGRCLDELSPVFCRKRIEEGITVHTSVSYVDVDVLASLEPALESAACIRPGDVATYTLAMLNTNVHAYRRVTATIDVPHGLRVVDSYGPFGAGTITYIQDGRAQLMWRNLSLPARPPNTLFASFHFTALLRAGNAEGDFPVVSSATSIDGPILKKDSVETPSVVICNPQPVLAKEASRETANTGELVHYLLTLSNHSATQSRIVVTDALPPQLAFSGTLHGPEPEILTGNVLSWTVDVPGTADGITGTASLRFAALVTGTERRYDVVNVAHQAQGEPLSRDFATATMRINADVFPLTATYAAVLEGTGCIDNTRSRTVRINITNPNIDEYRQTTVTLQLPFGLRVGSAFGHGGAPTVVAEPDGTQTLIWRDFVVPARATGQTSSTTSFTATLFGGPVLGSFALPVTVQSADGAIVPAAGATTPQVAICALSSSVAKAASQPDVTTGGTLWYVVSVANASSQPINVTLADSIPSQFSYSATVRGPQPSAVSGNTLTWTLSVPAAVGATPGVISTTFVVSASSYAANVTTTNTVRQTAGPVLNRDRASAVVRYNPGVVETPATYAVYLTGMTCQAPNVTRSYRLNLGNPTAHPYRDTLATVRVPAGQTVNAPGASTVQNGDGSRTLTWSNINMPAGIGADYAFSVTGAITRVSLALPATATSRDGTFVQIDPDGAYGVPACDTGSYLRKTTPITSARTGDTVVYDIELINGSGAIDTVTVVDALPAQLAYSETLVGPAPASVAGNTLTWNTSVPLASSAIAGRQLIRIATRVVATSTTNVQFTNSVVQTAGRSYDASQTSATVLLLAQQSGGGGGTGGGGTGGGGTGGGGTGGGGTGGGTNGGKRTFLPALRR